MIWDSEPPDICEGSRDHVWGDENIIKKRGCIGGSDYVPTQKKDLDSMYKSQGQFCQICGAWRGCLGLEPTPELYIKHMVQIFRELRRVLRSDGTLWLNMGDSYATSMFSHNYPRKVTQPQTNWKKTKLESRKSHIGNVEVDKDPNGLKPKDLCGIPWALAFALRADGWYLRSDIIWHKPNPMPESVTDRPTKSHEYLFLLSKSQKYFYDNEAIKEELKRPEEIHRKTPAVFGGANKYPAAKLQSRLHSGNLYTQELSGRNKHTVWTIATQPFPQAHFAIFPEKLIEPCILAGTSEKGCCVECRSPWDRVVDVTYKNDTTKNGRPAKGNHKHNEDMVMKFASGERTRRISKTIGWKPTCKCGNKTYHTRDERQSLPIKPCVVLDLFFGSGTTGIVAYKHNRKFVGIELSEKYLTSIAIPRIEKATEQLKLF